MNLRTLSKKNNCWKTVIAFDYFPKTLHLKSLRGFWIYVWFYTNQGSEYCRIAKMPGFWISRVRQGLAIFVNMTGFWICVGMQLQKGYEYSRILNMPSFFICKCYIRFWICLNMAEYSWINCSDYGKVLNMPGQSFTGFWKCLRF